MPRFRIEVFSCHDDFNGELELNLNNFGYYCSGDVLDISGRVRLQGEMPEIRYKVLVDGALKEEGYIDTDRGLRNEFQGGMNDFCFHHPYHITQDKIQHVVIKVYSINGGVEQKIVDIALLKDEVHVAPVFVLGSPRSGTTAIGNALRTILDAKNYGEYHTGYLWANILAQVDEYFSRYHTRNDVGAFIQDVSPALIKAKLGQSIKELLNDYHSEKYIVDKTPGRNMIESLPYLQSIWPDMKLLFCKRRAIENVDSRMKKFPQLNLEQHARQWVETVHLWNKIKHEINIPFLELDHYDVTFKTDEVDKKISSFLKIKNSGAISEYLKNNFPQATTRCYEIKSLGEMEWSIDEKKMFSMICKEVMESEGYSLDDNYFLDYAVL